MKWTQTQWQRRRESQEQERGKERARAEEGGRKGVFRIVIGAVEVITNLKSSRCGPAPENKKKSKKLSKIKRENKVCIRLCLSTWSEVWFGSGIWYLRTLIVVEWGRGEPGLGCGVSGGEVVVGYVVYGLESPVLRLLKARVVRIVVCCYYTHMHRSFSNRVTKLTKIG